MTNLMRTFAALGLLFVSWLLRGSRSPEEDVHSPIVRFAVNHPWLTTGAMAAGAIVVAAAIVISGIVPIKASSGHWAITAALLDFAKTRSVATQAWGIKPPPLDDVDLVLRGAGHYEGACLPCHGGPGRSIPPVMAAMTPAPPELGARLSRWTPAQLFSIVKHGIKFTGMPAWPEQQRDDEVWAMVAFLRRMPSLDSDGYRRLVPDPAAIEAPPVVQQVCSRCHAADGTGRGSGAFPSLAGQRAAYIYESLRAFHDRERFSGIMSEVAARLSDELMLEIARYFEGLPPRTVKALPDDAAWVRGRTIALEGIAQRDIPACVECHGPSEHPKNPAHPILAAQHARYLVAQLVLMQERRRGGTSRANLMHPFVNRLKPDDIRDVTGYFAALPGTERGQ
jgi:cytochrome c553